MIVETLRDAGGSIFGPRDQVTPIAVCEALPWEPRVVAARAQPIPEKAVRLAGEGSVAGLAAVKPAIWRWERHGPGYGYGNTISDRSIASGAVPPGFRYAARAGVAERQTQPT